MTDAGEVARRLRELAAIEATAQHWACMNQIARVNQNTQGHSDTPNTCPHPDCALVRADGEPHEPPSTFPDHVRPDGTGVWIAKPASGAGTPPAEQDSTIPVTSPAVTVSAAWLRELQLELATLRAGASRCANCDHVEPHTASTAGGGPNDPFDGCTRPGCSCGYDSRPSAPASPPQWLPIESAPKGQDVLILAGGHHRGDEGRIMVAYSRDGASWWSKPGCYSIPRPMHWTPIPSAALAGMPSPQPERDPNRCAVCGWTLADQAMKGCVRGNCSLRPRPDRLYDPERAKRELDELIAVVPSPAKEKE